MIPRTVTVIFTCIVLISITGKAFSVDSNDFFLRVIKQPEETVILEFPVAKGDHFYIDYTHSSDHTPIHDIFTIGEAGMIILIEEDYAWYGAGLEFHPDADAQISLTGDRVRVLLHRTFPYLPLRVGRVAGHTLTYKDKKIPLLAIAEGGDRVWIVTVKKGETND
jgi:hypothetical protein